MQRLTVGATAQFKLPVAADEAVNWEKQVARRLRVQYVYKVGTPWKVAGAEGGAGLGGFLNAVDAERYQIGRVERYAEAIASGILAYLRV